MSRDRREDEMVRVAACSNCYDKAENYCCGYKENCNYRDNMKQGIKNLVDKGYGDIKQAQIDILNKLKKIIHEDDFQQLCLDGVVEEVDIFNYIDNLIKEIEIEKY